jgi:hypothetical protein
MKASIQFAGTLAAALLGMLVATTLSGAAIHYVAPTGLDSNAGTAEKPLRTIQRAADLVRPGDKVVVRAGVFLESITIKSSGLPEKPIVFEGERGPGGEWLTIVDRSTLVGQWVPAPEIGPGVFKAVDLAFAPYSMTLQDKQLARVSDRLMEEEKGLSYFKLPRVAMIKEEYLRGGEMDFWDGVEVIYGHRKGVTYIRFRNGDHPNAMVLKAAPAGGGFLLKDKSHVVVRNFSIRGSQDGIVIEGPQAQHNVVEQNFLTNGHNRVVIAGGASRNVVRDNQMTLNYHGYADPGAWGTPRHTSHTAIRLHIYRVFKIIVGPGGSDDRGVLVRSAGEDNEVCGNHIYAGLIGISCGQSCRLKVHHNVIHNMSSIGILTSEDGGKGPHDAEFHDNLVYDCNINLRIHHYNAAGDNQRREFHYRNLYYLPDGLGDCPYVHWLNDRWPANTEHPEIWLYHNTFAGGNFAMSPSGWSVNGGGLQRTRLLNNVFSSPMFFYAGVEFISGANMMGACDYNWIGGQLHHGVPTWFGPHNVINEQVRLWPANKMPDFRLASGSPARGKGLDLSKPFLLAGHTYDPLPGMKKGYFTGPAPDCGALQFGESSRLVPPPGK